MPAVEVFADVRCPFAHLSLRRLVDRRAALGLDFMLRVRAWPLELVNGAPMNATVVGDESEALRRQVAPDLYAGFPGSVFPRTSLPALALTAAAYDRGPVAGEGVALALRWALFEQGRDIASEAVLGDVAEQWEVTMPEAGGHDRVVADWHDGRDRGVVGSPHFFVGDDAFFCPLLKIDHGDGHLRITEDDRAAQDFVARLSSV